MTQWHRDNSDLMITGSLICLITYLKCSLKIIENTEILLINIPIDGVFDEKDKQAQLSLMPPLGLLYILSSLNDAGYKVRFIDMAVEVFDEVRKAYEAGPTSKWQNHS